MPVRERPGLPQESDHGFRTSSHHFSSHNVVTSAGCRCACANRHGDDHRADYRSTGATLPGVTVTATNQATNVDYTAVTNESGDYTITPVVAGTYVIKAALSGFRTQATAATVLEARQVARLDFKMGVGIAETVEVSEATPILQTETTAVGEVLSGNTVQSLPLNGRNTGQLALLLPGTITYNPRGFTNIGSINMNRPFVNGNREQTNNFTVDGLDVNETIDNRVAYQPSPDALSQISVETNNYPADVGNVGGAMISSVIKSGSNRFSGNAFEFYRNSDFDANTWENNRSSAAKQERKQHIYGGTLGGPIAASKVFFFGDYQGSRHDAPGETTATVAPEAWRRGDLSSFTTPIINPQTGLAFPVNQIPVSMFSPTARAILNDLVELSAAQSHGDRGHRELRRTDTVTVRAHQGDARIDWNASDQRQVLRPLLLRDLRGPPRPAALPAVPRHPERSAVSQCRLQLESRHRQSDGQRAAGRLQPHNRDVGERSTGPASAMATHSTGLPAASRSPGSSTFSGRSCP